jgi:hypothetical protein
MISTLVILATPAAAETCEALLIKVEAAMESSQATAEKKEQAQKLRDEGTVQRVLSDECEPVSVYLTAASIRPHPTAATQRELRRG